jgi:phage terminase large subunit-like protein
VATDVNAARGDVDRARTDLAAFSRLVGRELTGFQAEALSLATRHTVLLAPRQTGKSWSLATLTAWWLFRQPRQEVLVLSAREDTAKNLLKAVRQVAGHRLLKLSVVEDLKTRLELSNGSAVEAVPSSEAAIRGRSVDLLIVDEAAFVPTDLIESAALPTTMARPDARVVLASTPWGTSGVFHDWYTAGSDGTDPDTRAFRWSLGQCPWVVPSVIEAMRRRLPALKFAAEVMGEWVPGGDSFFPPEDLEAAFAGFPLIRDGEGSPAVLGADWGRDRDTHAIAIAGVLGDGGANGRPVVVVPYVEVSRRPYAAQEDEIAALAGMWDLTVMSERKGVGIAPTEALVARLTRSRVIPVRTTADLKEQAYSRLARLLSERSIVLPDVPVLRRQLAGIVARPTPLGGLKIEARSEAIHDDLADALAFAVLGLPAQLADPPACTFPDGTEWAETRGGVRIPLPVTTVRADASYADLNGGFTVCGSCGLPYPPGRVDCRWCSAPNPDAPAKTPAPAAPVIASGPAAEAEHVPNAWNSHLMRCPAGHVFDGKYLTACPQCRPGTGRTSQGLAGLPAGIGVNLGALLGPRR